MTTKNMEAAILTTAMFDESCDWCPSPFAAHKHITYYDIDTQQDEEVQLCDKCLGDLLEREEAGEIETYPKKGGN